MPELQPGSTVHGRDMPPAQFDLDWTTISNITTTSYITGTPSVGVTFTAPSSGRVLVAIGCGIRNNAATTERAIVTFAILEDNIDGVVHTAVDGASGVMSQGVPLSQDFTYMGSLKMVSDLTPGKGYLCQVYYRSTAGAGTVDISSRDVSVIPLT